MRINELDAVAFNRQEENARRIESGEGPTPEREPWLTTQWTTFAPSGALAARLPVLCETVVGVFEAAGQPMPATGLTFAGGGLRFSEKALNRLVEYWAAGSEHLVTVDFNTEDMERQADIRVTGARREGEATLFEVTVWKAPDVGAIADELIRLVSTEALFVEAVYAAITYDYAQSPQLPFEMWYGIFDGEQHADRFARGYYWANLLSQHHLQDLGGIASAAELSREAGMVFSIVRDRAGEEMAWVRMPGRVDQISDDDLAAMKGLLAPVLPQVRYRYYEGYTLRVLKDPGDACIVPPAGTKLPRWDRDGNPMPSEPEDDEYRLWLMAKKLGTHRPGPRDEEFEARFHAEADEAQSQMRSTRQGGYS